jgi:anti-anti-sigma factor
MTMNFESACENGIATVRVDADVIAAEQGGLFMARVTDSLSDASMAVVDLSGVLEMSSVVAYALVRLLSERAQGHPARFAIAAPPAAVKRLFKLLDLDTLVPVHDYTENAMLALQAANLLAQPPIDAGRSAVTIQQARR